MPHTEQGSPHVQFSVSARYAMIVGRYAAQNCRAHFIFTRYALILITPIISASDHSRVIFNIRGTLTKKSD